MTDSIYREWNEEFIGSGSLTREDPARFLLFDIVKRFFRTFRIGAVPVFEA
jgi:hypothetical protein